LNPHISQILILLAWLPATFPVAFCPCKNITNCEIATGCTGGCCEADLAETCQADRETPDHHEAGKNRSQDASVNSIPLDTSWSALPNSGNPEKTPANCPLCSHLPPDSMWEGGTEFGSNSGTNGTLAHNFETFWICLFSGTTNQPRKSQLFCFDARGPLFLIQLCILI
jgi:hypothetical protein